VFPESQIISCIAIVQLSYYRTSYSYLMRRVN